MPREVSADELELLQTMARDDAADVRTRNKARTVLTYLRSADYNKAAREAGVTVSTARKYVALFEEGGW
jgi:transposase